MPGRRRLRRRYKLRYEQKNFHLLFIIYLLSLLLLAIYLYKLLERFQRTSAEKRCARFFHTRFDALFGTDGVNAKGSIDKHTVALEVGGCATKHVVENCGSLFGGVATMECLRRSNVEAQLRRTVDALRVVGHHLEVVGQRYFVIPVKARNYGEPDAYLLKCVGVEAHLLKVGHTEELVGCVRWIDQGTKEVEERFHAQLLTKRTHHGQGGVEQGCMQVGHATRFDAAHEAVGIVGELDAVELKYSARTTHRRSSIVAMLSHLVACTSNNKAGTRGNVERVFPIATRTNYVEGFVGRKVDGTGLFDESVAEAKELFHMDVAHAIDGEQSRYLCLNVAFFGYAYEEVVSFLTGEYVVMKQMF